MVMHWSFCDKNTSSDIILDKYTWGKKGLEVIIKTFNEKSEHEIKYSLLFHVEAEGFRVKFLPNSLAANDWVYDLMCKASVDAPCIPLFVQDESELIEEVKEAAGYDADEKKYYHYVIYTVDMWIDVVSSEPPTIKCLAEVEPL